MGTIRLKPKTKPKIILKKKTPYKRVKKHYA